MAKRKQQSYYEATTDGKRLKEDDGLLVEEGVRCGVEFFDKPCIELAREMLGCVLVCKEEDSEGEECRGEIVEVEAYLGGDDRAAHSYNARRTTANEAMYMAPGTAYVYSIYGVHHCFNISSIGPGAAVLVRAVRPTSGLEIMRERRERGRRKMKDVELCNGPGKLCQAFNITKQYNIHDKLNLITSSTVWLERGSPCNQELIKESSRIGISSSAGEQWTNALLRYHITSHRSYVSKSPK